MTNNDGKLVVSTSTSWALSNLAGKLFFNFTDVKPGDIGEDTISLHVNTNNAYACMNDELDRHARKWAEHAGGGGGPDRRHQ